MNIEKNLHEQYEWIYFRVSKITKDQYNGDIVTKLFNDYPLYLVAYEEGRRGDNPHIQGVYANLKEKNDIDLKEEKLKLKEMFKKDGIQNCFLYAQFTTDRKGAIKYNLKEGDFVYKGFTKKFIEDMLKCTTKKEKFKKKMEQLEEDVILKVISWNTYMIKYIKTLSEHGYEINDGRVKAKFNTMLIRAGYHTPTSYVEERYSEYLR